MAYDYNGSNQTHVDTGNSPLSAYPFTVAIRFYPHDTLPGAAQLMYTSYDGIGSHLIYLGVNSTDNLFFAATTNGGASPIELATSLGTFTQNAWNTGVGFMATSTSRGVSLNGSSSWDIDEDALDFPANAGQDEEIGGVLTTNNNFDGVLADLAIWSTNLTIQEANAYHAGISPLLIRPAGLISYRPLIRDTRDWIQGNSLTANNGPTVAAHPPTNPQHAQILHFPPVTEAGGLPIPVASYHYNHNE